MIIFKRFNILTANEDEWKGYHTIRRKLHKEQTPDEPYMTDKANEISRKGAITTYGLQIFYFHIYSDETIIGFLNCSAYGPTSASFKGNEGTLYFDIRILQAYQRKGIGAQAMKILLELGQKHAKSIFLNECLIPEAKYFYEAIGASIGQIHHENKLLVREVKNSLLYEWITEAEAKNPQTSIKLFEGSIPDEYVKEFALSFTESGNDQPRGDLETGDEVLTVDQIRKDEKVANDAGFKVFTCMTVEKSGQVSGVTQVKMFPGREKILAQSLTGVPKRFRGRKLGKWVKAKILLNIKEHYPEVEAIITGNAETNSAMLHINNSLGFKKYKELIAYKITLEQIRSYLNSKEVPFSHLIM